MSLHIKIVAIACVTFLFGCTGNSGNPGGFALGTGIGGLGIGGMSGVGMGTEYGSGGMELGVHLGGWGDGYGGGWGHGQSAPAGPMDNDPHYTSSYQNPAFKSNQNDFYHPATSN
jgi:hypothetical protein